MGILKSQTRPYRATCLRALAAAPVIAFLLGGCATPAAIQSFTLDSPFLRRPTEVEVLAPDAMEQGRQYPVLYMLPVNAGSRGIWGAASLQAHKHDIVNRYGVICVWPTFALPPR